MSSDDVAKAAQAAFAASASRAGTKRMVRPREESTPKKTALVATPKHDPCGVGALGSLDAGTLTMTCTQITPWARCECQGLHVAYQREKRRNRSCLKCGGSGWIPVGALDGCGKTFPVCRFCGLRYEAEKGCEFHGFRTESP